MNANERFRDSFLVGANRLLDELSALLLGSEGKKELSAEDIDLAFRILHTIKGSAGTMDLGGLSLFAHTLEGLFGFIRKSEGLSNNRWASLLDLMFEASDSMRSAIDEFARDGTQSRDFSPLIKKLSDWQESITETMTLRITLKDDCAMENIRAYLIVSALASLSPGLTYYPYGLDAEDGPAKAIREDGLYIRFAKVDEGEILKALEQDTYVGGVTQVEKLPIEQDVEDAHKASLHQPRETIAGNYVAVRLDKLDKLQTLANELIRAQNLMLSGAGADRAQSRTISKQSAALQSAVMELRMTPVSSLFQKLHRTVREAGRKLEREIEFVQEGSDIEIDKGILDALSESMVQLVRNAAVHGIEPAAQRLIEGKPIMGRITVSARNAGAHVVLTVSDDGRGISPEKVAAAATQAGRANVPPPDNQHDLLSLIMTPGITTRSQADEMSGRGVGLDVVRSAIEKLKGTITLKSQIGRGSVFTIRVGQSMAVMDCVPLMAGKTVFLLPTGDIYKLLKPRRKDVLALPDKRRFLMFQGFSLNVINLSELYGDSGDKTDITSGVVAILEGESSAVAVYFDKILPPVRAAIKPLPGLINALGAIKNHLVGCALLPDQVVGLVLDAQGLLGEREAV